MFLEDKRIRDTSNYVRHMRLLYSNEHCTYFNQQIRFSQFVIIIEIPHTLVTEKVINNLKKHKTFSFQKKIPVRSTHLDTDGSYRSLNFSLLVTFFRYRLGNNSASRLPLVFKSRDRTS